MSKKEQKEKEPVVVEKRPSMKQGPKPVSKPLNYPKPIGRASAPKAVKVPEYSKIKSRVSGGKEMKQVKGLYDDVKYKKVDFRSTISSAGPGIIDRASRLIPPLDYKKQAEQSRERILKRLAPKPVTKRPADKA